MAKDKLNQENIEVNQSKESGTKVTSEKATIFSYLSDINRIKVDYTKEPLKIKYKWASTHFIFPTQDSFDLEGQKLALRLEGKIEEAFSLNQSISPKERTNQKKWRILAVVLLIIGIGGLSANSIYGTYLARKIEQNTQISMEKIKKVNPAKSEDEKQERSAFKEQPYQPIETYLDDSDIETYLGSIAIPDVNLNLPIVKGVGEQNLYRGAATNKIGQQMGKGNYPMAAHKVPGNDTSLFGPLFQVTPGMKIYLSDNQNIYIYTARESYVVEPERVDILDDVIGQTLLTLYTCSTDAGVERLVVQADFEKQLKMTDASPEEQAIFARE